MTAGPAQLHEFVSEAREHLAGVADDLLALEQRRDDFPARSPLPRRPFRQGWAGYFGCKSIERLSHAMEAILEHLRERQEPPATSVVDALLAAIASSPSDDVEHSNDADVTALVDRRVGSSRDGAPGADEGAAHRSLVHRHRPRRTPCRTRLPLRSQNRPLRLSPPRPFPTGRGSPAA
jgi:chemotaxis protein histidine kinase CheA